jgi:Fe-Mn family superoxide dismutase
MGENIDRREFATTIATATAAAVVLSNTRDADAQRRGAPAQPTLLGAPEAKSIVPLPFAPTSLSGLSERLLTSHHDNNYGGAVRKLNEIRQQLGNADPTHSGGYWSMYGSLKSAELAARNSSLLHEMYFANLAAGQQPPASVAQLISQRFGSMENFQTQLRGSAAAASGWIVLVADPTSRTLELVQTEGHAFGSWEAAPLLVLDVFEHAYAIDYGANKNGYVDAFWRNVNWQEVGARATHAIGRL